MLQSQIINVLPRRILAGLWATPETRLSISHFAVNNTKSIESTYTTNNANTINNNNCQKLPSPLQSLQPAATLPNFICNELPVRYTHILRLLSTLSPESLQSPIIRNVAHSYLHDICTLLHPSLKSTSPKAFSKVLSNIRTSQSTNLIRLKYALLSNPNNATVTLMENINTISFGIHHLIDQHLSWNSEKNSHAQKICPEEIAHQAIEEAKISLSNVLGSQHKVPMIEVKNCTKESDFTFVPDVLHRILYESVLISLKAQAIYTQENEDQSWIKRQWSQYKNQDRFRPLSLRIFGGPTSVGFRLDSPAPLLEQDLQHGIPRDPIGLPTCGSVLSSTGGRAIDQKQSKVWVDWAAMSGWRSAKTMASHWGGNLDVVSVDGLGHTLYLALDRDTTLLERYPSRIALAASAQRLLFHNRRISAISSDHTLSIQAAATQLDAFLYAISDSQQTTFGNPTPLHHHHSVSLTAAVGHA